MAGISPWTAVSGCTGALMREEVIERLHREVPAILLRKSQLAAGQGAQDDGGCVVRQRRHVALELNAVVKPLLDVRQIDGVELMPAAGRRRRWR